jgi:ComF family protein
LDTVTPQPKHQRLTLADGTPLDCYSLFLYQDAVQHAILDLKFHEQRANGDAIGLLLSQQKGICRLVSQADFITAVPISKKRKRERDYNQSEVIGRRLAAETGSVYQNVLEKWKDNDPQSSLNRQQRLENPVGVYRAAKGAAVKEQSVLLLDDIVTTGATLCNCALALYAAGAKQVTAVTFAHATIETS